MLCLTCEVGTDEVDGDVAKMPIYNAVLSIFYSQKVKMICNFILILIYCYNRLNNIFYFLFMQYHCIIKYIINVLRLFNINSFYTSYTPLVYNNSIHDKHRFYRHNTYVDVRVEY